MSQPAGGLYLRISNLSILNRLMHLDPIYEISQFNRFDLVIRRVDAEDSSLLQIATKYLPQ